jgi:hypothetical protein
MTKEEKEEFYAYIIKNESKLNKKYDKVTKEIIDIVFSLKEKYPKDNFVNETLKKLQENDKEIKEKRKSSKKHLKDWKNDGN